ncbi:hypothetical protein BGX23_012279, partial [Mortierella sp. AD031]
LSGQQLPTFSDINKSANPSSTSSTPSSNSNNNNNARASAAALYPNGTPPMSPGHALLSPLSRPHCGITDPSQYSSSSSGGGFYQLPPPVQPFGAPRPSPHQSPAIHPQSNTSSHHHPLPPLPPLPGAASSTTTYSPRSTPQMSPIANHYLVSPALGPLSPYPTPQHQPRHYSSPHHDPTMMGSKQSIPAMILPASALSSGSVPHEFASSSASVVAGSSRSYSTILPQGIMGSIHNSNVGSDFGSPTNGPVDRSAPPSPRRFVMLPPQSTTPASVMGTDRRPSRSQGRKASASSGGSSSTAAISTAAAAAGAGGSTSSSSTRRRPSSNSRVVDQETRDLMRKVSHSAIERRRRERINDKILQLKHLVPACVDEDHLHKLSILQSTIEYIQHLKSVLPDSVANAKIGKATNSNPNNKTTDMLDALGAGIAKKVPLTPLMTTELNRNVYPKRLKLDKHHSSSHQQHQGQQQHYGSGSYEGASGMHSHSSSSDEDAKDGLLLLAGGQSSASSSSSSSSTSSIESGSGSRSDHKRGLRKRDRAQGHSESG